MSVRLTNDLRDIICRKAVSHAFDPKKEALTQVEHGLAKEAYEAVFSDADRKAVAKVGKDWVRFDSCLKFNVGGLTITLNAAGEGFPVPYRINGYRGYSCNILGTVEFGELADRIQKHANDLEAYEAERTKAAKQLSAMLSKINTIKKLREVWPEGAQFYSKYEVESVAALPAIRVDEINSMLGLAA